MSRLIRPVATLLAGLLLQGCASTSSVSTRFLADNSESVRTLMVAARTPEPLLRKDYERACAAALGERAKGAYRSLPDWHEAGYQQLVKGLTLDAVLVIDITPLIITPMQMPPANEVSSERFGSAAGPTFNTWESGGNQQATAVAGMNSYDIEARLIKADNQVLWEGLIRTNEANDLQAIARSQCQALDSHLRKLGLLD